MNSRVTASPLSGRRRAWLGLTLLLPAVATEVAPTTGASLPYLRYIGPPPLRFQVARPPPEITVRPLAAAGPPKSSEKASSTLNPSAPLPSKATAGSASLAGSAVSVGKSTGTVTVAGKSLDRPVKPVGPDPLLPDDAGPKVRPEDFLPFFQFPGARNAEPKTAAAPAPPSPGVQPPSSATYQQIP